MKSNQIKKDETVKGYGGDQNRNPKDVGSAGVKSNTPKDTSREPSNLNKDKFQDKSKGGAFK